ncbi:hypothetical protein B5807_03112 [Epicoccum nigrum]|uniref:Arrestin-like N-terminal domain-containing protein n=1 Tax=Epicoccum nigrum TaxID=105696 RepID=A0A1Y2M732_EPING|nr:hypothetical protein B5807_03112 [Epicoccum nigrum]
MSPSYTINNKRLPIYIDLQSTSDFFTDNDAVRGSVRVHPTERPRRIKIEFEGLCKTKIVEGSGNAKKTYKERPQLFLTSLLLFNSETHGESYDIVNRGIEEDGKVTLPFEFSFPSQVTTAPPIWYKPREGFEHEAGHPLPPTLHHTDNVVEYLLKVSVYKKEHWPEVIALSLPFRPASTMISPSVLVRPPWNTTLSIRTQQLNPRNAQDPGILTKLKWSALPKYHDTVPEASWKLAAQCPYQLIVGKQIPISFSFQHIKHTSEMSEVPPVYIREIRVKVTSILAVRVPYQGMTSNRDIVEDFPCDIIARSFPGHGQVMYDGFQLSELGPLVLPRTTLPSCKSYGLRLRYRIKVILSGECAGKSFTRDALRDACEVVMPQRPGGDASVAAPLETAGGATQVEEPLPAYEEAPGYVEEPSEAPEDRFNQAAGSNH